MYDAGEVVGFYSIEDRTAVIVDICEGGRELCQRVIGIDRSKKMAECILYRRHSIPNFSAECVLTCVDKGLALTVAYHELPIKGLTYPMNHLSNCHLKDISPLFIKANEYLERTGLEVTITNISPFSFSKSKLGCRVRDADQQFGYNSCYLLVIDIMSEAMKLLDVPDAPFKVPETLLFI
ncbi:hypothetical protein PENTCL1PPCAC_11817 [Pristionchus entomophagus]|uniref:Uncharacterized protein n=1 Tax=Pristionchus entomophagus TaxID=358040 RepID=A0AAV5T587_9BILA|nr:hypothetical protein PENTCL1PPCAC_11817 [Pristionchus entomophagus]